MAAKKTTARDLTGHVFGKLTAIRPTAQRYRTFVVWHCRCACGNDAFVGSGILTSGNTRSCGCVFHGHAAKGGTREYKSWQSMLSRCRNPNDPMFQHYGGRGITVCDRWQNFETFLSDMGQRPRGTSVERIDNSAGYTPENCKWANQTEQNRNRSITRWFTLNGVTMCMTEWADRLGITKTAMSKRLARWPLERALTAPADARRK